MKDTMIRSEIEKIQEIENVIDNSGAATFDPKGHYITIDNPHKLYQAIEALITKSNQELLSRVERELPEKHKLEDILNTEYDDIWYKAAGHNEALDQTKATIDRIRGEL